MKLLIVDDSKELSDVICFLLSKIEGVQIIGQEANPLSAMESIQLYHPDTMILDLQLSGGNGFEVLKFTKRNYPSTKVIVLTNYAYTPYREKCHSLGADYFLDKSSDCQKLQNIIKSMVSKNPGINIYSDN